MGHAHPEVATAIAAQAGQLLHGMGDVHPPSVKVELLEALCSRFPGGEPARPLLLRARPLGALGRPLDDSDGDRRTRHHKAYTVVVEVGVVVGPPAYSQVPIASAPCLEV